MIINLQKENSKCSNCAVYHRHCSYCEEEAGASGIHLIKVRSYLVLLLLFFSSQDTEMNKFAREGMRGGVTSLFDSRITFTGSADEENFILGKLQDFTRESEGARASAQSKIRYAVPFVKYVIPRVSSLKDIVFPCYLYVVLELKLNNSHKVLELLFTVIFSIAEP